MGKKGEMKEKKEEKGPLQAPMGLQGPPPLPPRFSARGSGDKQESPDFSKSRGALFFITRPCLYCIFQKSSNENRETLSVSN